jgi:Fe-S-cluster containining protein
MRRLSLPVVARLNKVRNETVLELATIPYAGQGGETICVAFSGNVGGECGCSIHADRPALCRAFEPGELKCRIAREAAGLDPDP